MSKQVVIEVIYGRFHKYEVIKSSSLFSSPSFYVHRDGKHFKGSYDSLAAAVEAARQAG